MRKELLSILACPQCRGDLRLEGAITQGESIYSGLLICDHCAEEFEVQEGIPRFEGNRSNTPQSTAGHFEREFTQLSENDRDIEPPEMAEYYFFTRSALDAGIFEAFPDDYFLTDLEGRSPYHPDYSSISDKVVLDAGCGAGRFTRVVGQKARLVVGLELGGHVDRAARFCADLENVEFVQGSVLAPPFKEEAFGLVFSIGVLHHTPDPREGCLRLASLVSDRGSLSVWVYPPEYWNGPIRGPVARTMNRVVSRLPGAAAHGFCAWILYPLGRIQGFLARRRWAKFLFAPVFLLPVPRHPRREVMINTIYDYYGPRIISTHTYEDLESWFREAGLVELRKGRLPTSLVAMRDQRAS